MKGKVDVCFGTHVTTRDQHWEDVANAPMEKGQEVEICDGIRVSWLTDDLREKLGEACQPRGYNIGRGAGPVVTYGLVRENAPAGAWDPDGVLALIVALSRIVHPSAHGFNASGSLHFSSTGELDSVFAVNGDGAFRPPTQRPWLTTSDWEDVGQLYRAYDALPILQLPELPQESSEPKRPVPLEKPKSMRRFPLRLHRALWNLAYAAYVEPAHIRWLIVATALEGLIETGVAARQEFIQRILEIAKELGKPITRGEVDAIYSIRSTAAHRGWLSGKTDRELDASYVPMDRIVGGVLRQAISDDRFRMAFESRETIAQRWPVVLTPEVM